MSAENALKLAYALITAMMTVCSATGPKILYTDTRKEIEDAMTGLAKALYEAFEA